MKATAPAAPAAVLLVLLLPCSLPLCRSFWPVSQADMVVLDRDISHLLPPELGVAEDLDLDGSVLLDCQVEETWVGGRRCFQRQSTEAVTQTQTGDSGDGQLPSPPPSTPGTGPSVGNRGSAVSGLQTGHPNGPGRNGPTRAPVAVGAGGCMCCRKFGLESTFLFMPGKQNNRRGRGVRPRPEVGS